MFPGSGYVDKYTNCLLYTSTPAGARMGTDGMGARESYRELILENIEYDFWKNSDRVDHEMLDEITELIVDTVCSARKTIRIAGDDYPAEVVKSRFLKLDSSHVQYVMDCMKDNTTYVRNIKKYLLAALYNACLLYTSAVSPESRCLLEVSAL